MQQPRLIQVTKEQLELFNQHFRLALDKKCYQTYEDYEITFDDLKNDYLNEIDMKDAETYHEDTTEIYYITKGDTNITMIDQISDLEYFILNEMQDYL